MPTEERDENTNTLSEEKQKNSSQKRRYTRYTFLFLTVLFCGALYFAWLFFQGPAVGVIQSGTLPKKEESFDQGTEVKHFTGNYFSFSYPGVYGEKSHTLPTTGPVKETVFLSASNVEGKKIAITEEERENNSLDASPAFQMRQRDSKTYKKSLLKLDGIDRVLFTKNSQVFEQTVFLQKKNFILIISASSPFSVETLLEDVQNIFATLQWKTNE